VSPGDDPTEADATAREEADREPDPNVEPEPEPEPEPNAPGAGRQEVLLFVRPGRDRELLAEGLQPDYRLRVAEEPAALEEPFDLCVVDAASFRANRDAIERRKTAAAPEFLPVLLLLTGDADPPEQRWTVADDVVELPVGRVEFAARVESLLERRATATELVETSRELAETVAELRMKERAMDAAPVGITIAEAGDDNPMTYANEAFERITGYPAVTAVGRNCRFLQGDATDPETVRRMGEAIDEERPVAVDVLNYRHDGSRFWNRVEIAPVEEDGETVSFVGFQSDITDRKIREQRLEVLNRVLTHNLRNRLNVVQGYASMLEEELADSDLGEYAARVGEATGELLELSEKAHQVERSLPDLDGEAEPLDLSEVVRRTAGALRERYPETTFDTTLPDGEPLARCDGLSLALEEVADALLGRNAGEDRRLRLALSVAGDRLELTVADDGPGLPVHEQEVLDAGMESPLKHSDGVGLWMVQWIVSSAGGSVRFEEDGAVTLSLPRHRPDRSPEAERNHSS
jgi:PAS domain S-box-containing protein